jgi:hypothetical protein
MLFNSNNGDTNAPLCYVIRTLTVLLVARMGQDRGVAATDGHIVPASGEEGNIKMTLMKIGYWHVN